MCVRHYMYRSRTDEPTTPSLQVWLHANILLILFWGCETMLWQWMFGFLVFCLFCFLLFAYYCPKIKKKKMFSSLSLAFHATQMACRNHYWLTPVLVLAVVNYKRSRSSPEAVLLPFVSSNSSATPKPKRVVQQPHNHCVMLCWVGLDFVLPLVWSLRDMFQFHHDSLKWMGSATVQAFV